MFCINKQFFFFFFHETALYDHANIITFPFSFSLFSYSNIFSSFLRAFASFPSNTQYPSVFLDFTKEPWFIIIFFRIVHYPGSFCLLFVTFLFPLSFVLHILLSSCIHEFCQRLSCLVSFGPFLSCAPRILRLLILISVSRSFISLEIS